MSVTEELIAEEVCSFDDDYHHIADGPPFITTLCGIDVRGMFPTPKVKDECPICKALEKEIQGNL